MNLTIRIILFSNWFFLFYLVIYATWLLITNIYGSCRMYQYRKMERLHNELEHQFCYPISIIVPAYNENVTVIQTVRNLLKLDYRHFEIVLVDDGSTDNTRELLIKEFNLRLERSRPIRKLVPSKPITAVYEGSCDGINILLVCKENGRHKADANNAAINVISYPYFVCMDADEVLQRDALKYAGRAILEDANVIGVGGAIKISNGVTFKDGMPVAFRFGSHLVADMQTLEYGRSFVGSRIFQNQFNSNLIISGGYGVFRKDAVVAVGGYDASSMGEDMELTMKLHEYYRSHHLPYSMKYVPDSVCWTQAPDTMKDLRKQRQRWHCGLMQTIHKYRHMILNPSYGMIGMVILPYVLLYELYCPFFILLGWFVIGASWLLHLINIPFVLFTALLYLLFGVLLTMISYVDKLYMKKDTFTGMDILRGIGIAFLDALIFRPYLFIIEFLAFFQYRKIASSWVSPKRRQMQVE